MSSITVRRAEADDVDALALIGATTFLESYIEVIPGPDIIAHCRRQHGRAVYSGFLADPDPRFACWLAEHDETRAPVGYAILSPPDASVLSEPDDVELKRIYLLSRLHGTGAGQALIDAALSRASKLGAPRVLLGTYAGNHRAVAFYTRNGFRQISTRQFRVGDQLFDDIVMARTLG